MQQMMDMPRHTGCRIAVADAIRENYAGEIVATGKYRGEITAFIASGGHGDDIAFQPRKVQGAVGLLITSPKLHTAKRPHDRSGAIKLLRFDLFDLHIRWM